MTIGARIAFVGRAVIDLTVQIPHLPAIGRTVFGSGLTAQPGGKSLNQAVAAARLGAAVDLITNIGADAWGQQILDTVHGAGINISAVRVVPDTSTSAAIIEVTPDGESYILLALSEETALTENDVIQGIGEVPADLVVAQLDLPAQALDGLIRAPRPHMLIGNLIPTIGADRQLLPALDVYVVNRHEAAAVLNFEPHTAQEAADELRLLGPTITVVTDGAAGAAFSSPDDQGHIPAPEIDVVDSSGAGDAFLGALTVSLSRKLVTRRAVANAVAAGSNAVKYLGALPPDPTPVG